MVSSQFHYTKRNRFMPFLLAEILNFQGSTHHIGVGSFSNLLYVEFQKDEHWGGKKDVFGVYVEVEVDKSTILSTRQRDVVDSIFIKITSNERVCCYGSSLITVSAVSRVSCSDYQLNVIVSGKRN